MARNKQTKPVHQMTIAEWEKAFPDEDACCAYLVAHRWPTGVVCPRCGATNVYTLGYAVALAVHRLRPRRIDRLSVLSPDRHDFREHQ